MSKITEVRLTLAAFLYAIEYDLKDLLINKVVVFNSDFEFVKNKELELKTIKRFQKDNPEIDYKNNISEVIDYLDFADTYEILLKNKGLLEEKQVKELKEFNEKFKELIPIRNRVMHTRPLLGGDFATVFAFITEVERCSILPWKQLIETKNRIETDPSYVLTLSIPSYSSPQYTTYNNLPLPDFDESGFIGRVRDVEDIKKLVLSNNRVVSIIGDGGIGKTALTLKIAYDLVDMGEECPFDMILWTSAKTTMLTALGIQEITNSLTDYSGLVALLTEAVESPKSDLSTNLNEIIEHFKIFNVLLIIDNLETIHNEEIRNFIREAQQYCKILITSRIGLGELEYPRKLNGFNEVEATRLIREIAKIRNSDILLQMDHKALVNISKKLYFNPLAIKWFVNSVETGLTPNEVFNNKGDLLEFCLSNVYDKLSVGAKNLLNILLSARRSLNDAELMYLMEIEPLNVKLSLNELHKTSFIEREILVQHESQEILYSVPAFAREYLINQKPINKIHLKEISKKLKELSKKMTDIQHANEFNEFGVNSITYRNTNEKIVARFLTEALKLSKRSNFTEAFGKIEDAKKVAPQFFEIYRISAFIKVANDNFLGADADYKIGLEIEPENPRLLFYYAQFLLFQLDDVDSALDMAEKVIGLRPNHPYPAYLYARCYSASGSYDKAIEKIEEILSTNSELNTKDKRIAYTDIINYYSRWASEKVKIENDYIEATLLFKKAIETFEYCVKNNLYDYKTIKNFCTTLIHFVSLVPRNYIENDLSQLECIFYKYENFIGLTKSKETIITRYKQNLQIYLSCISEKQTTEYKSTGTLDMCELDRSYCFVNSIPKRYFAHKSNFKKCEDWNSRKNGQFVSFVPDENDKGLLAKEIIVVNK